MIQSKLCTKIVLLLLIWFGRQILANSFSSLYGLEVCYAKSLFSVKDKNFFLATRHFFFLFFSNTFRWVLCCRCDDGWFHQFLIFWALMKFKTFYFRNIVQNSAIYSPILFKSFYQDNYIKVNLFFIVGYILSLRFRFQFSLFFFLFFFFIQCRKMSSFRSS